MDKYSSDMLTKKKNVYIFCCMSLLENSSDFNEINKVVQANALVQQTSWSFDEVPLKLFKMLISCINTNVPEQAKRVRLTKKQMSDFLFGADKNFFGYLKECCFSVQSQIVTIKQPKNKYWSLALVPFVEWDESNNLVTFEFNERLMPYLIELKNNFLQYDVAILKYLKGKYSLILYEYLLSQIRTNQSRRITFRLSRDELYEKIRISIEDLRFMFGTTTIFKEKKETRKAVKYPVFGDFEKRVLKPAIKSINESHASEFLVKYEKVKEGRNIMFIDFKVRKRTSYKETNFDEIDRPNRLGHKI